MKKAREAQEEKVETRRENRRPPTLTAPTQNARIAVYFIGESS
jgi:hypothetical protein